MGPSRCVLCLKAHEDVAHIFLTYIFQSPYGQVYKTT